MEIPNTPRTIISQLANAEKSQVYNGAWRRFFDIYHAPIALMIASEFNLRGWYEVPPHIVDEVVSDVVIALNKYFESGKYDASKGKFRYLLKKMAMCRAMDYMRRNYKYLRAKSIEFEMERGVDFESLSDDVLKLDEQQELAFKRAMLLDAYETVRLSFSPRTCLAFELIKLEGRPVDEVVRELGIDRNCANNAVYRIMQKLRKIISEDSAKG